MREVPDAAADCVDAAVSEMVQGLRPTMLTPADNALCDYARKLTLQPAAVTVDDVEQLRANGFTDRAIHDAAQVTAYFNYINRIADGLGVDPEPDSVAWEQR